MSFRPLVVVFGLALGDYLLWNWSLNTSHDAVALISGLTLPPLLIALVWLLVVSAMRGLMRISRREPQAARRRAASPAPSRAPRPGEPPLAPAATGRDADRTRRKLAA